MLKQLLYFLRSMNVFVVGSVITGSGKNLTNLIYLSFHRIDKPIVKESSSCKL